MFAKFFSRACNARNRIMSLLRGRLVEDEVLVTALNTLNEKLESKWSAELTIRVQKIIDEHETQSELVA